MRATLRSLTSPHRHHRCQGAAIELTVERPPPSEHANIRKNEEARSKARAAAIGQGNQSNANGFARLSLSKVPDDRDAVRGTDAMLGMEIHTISLAPQTGDPLVGLQVGVLNEVKCMTAHSLWNAWLLCVKRMAAHSMCSLCTLAPALIFDTWAIAPRQWWFQIRGVER